jgi:hypothetical protein
MAPGVIPLRFAIAGIEVLAKPCVANRCVADLTIRPRVDVAAEFAPGPFAAIEAFELTGPLCATFALDEAFFTFSRFHFPFLSLSLAFTNLTFDSRMPDSAELPQILRLVC